MSHDKDTERANNQEMSGETTFMEGRHHEATRQHERSTTNTTTTTTTIIIIIQKGSTTQKAIRGLSSQANPCSNPRY
jgi:hypothetical protein